MLRDRCVPFFHPPGIGPSPHPVRAVGFPRALHEVPRVRRDLVHEAKAGACLARTAQGPLFRGPSLGWVRQPITAPTAKGRSARGRRVERRAPRPAPHAHEPPPDRTERGRGPVQYDALREALRERHVDGVPVRAGRHSFRPFASDRFKEERRSRTVHIRSSGAPCRASRSYAPHKTPLRDLSKSPVDRTAPLGGKRSEKDTCGEISSQGSPFW